MKLSLIGTVCSALAVLVTGCASQTGQSSPQAAVAPTESAPAESVICDFFAADGAQMDVVNAAAEAINGENEAVLTRDAIEKMEEIAIRAAGDEREDLIAFADAMNDASISGEGWNGWHNAYEAFYVKYAEQCGQSVTR